MFHTSNSYNASETPPGDRFIRLPAVCDTTGMSRATVYRLIAHGDFPAPAKVGGMTFFSEREIQTWISAKLAAREIGDTPTDAPEVGGV
jgi:prophage regulatory protein